MGRLFQYNRNINFPLRNFLVLYQILFSGKTISEPLLYARVPSKFI